MNNSVTGINELKLDNLILEISDSASRIKSKLEKIEMLIDETNSYFKCDPANRFRNKFNEFKVNFSIANKNIMSISDDLINAKRKNIDTNDVAISGVNLMKKDIHLSDSK